jgi:aspartyl/asparaginyl beta-hydroxylase (cupin superfamily)
MNIIYHTNQLKKALTNHHSHVCFSIQDIPTYLKSFQFPQDTLWLESYHQNTRKALAILNAFLAKIKTKAKLGFNSVWNDKELIHYVQQYHHLFDEIVIVPLGNTLKRLWTENLNHLMTQLSMVPKEKLIVDIEIYPKTVLNDLSMYRQKLNYLNNLQLKSVAGVGNYLYQSEKDITGNDIKELVHLLKEGNLTYMMVHNRFLHLYGSYL